MDFCATTENPKKAAAASSLKNNNYSLKFYYFTIWDQRWAIILHIVR